MIRFAHCGAGAKSTMPWTDLLRKMHTFGAPTVCSLRSLPFQGEIVIALNITDGNRCTLSRRQIENGKWKIEELGGGTGEVARREW